MKPFLLSFAGDTFLQKTFVGTSSDRFWIIKLIIIDKMVIHGPCTKDKIYYDLRSKMSTTLQYKIDGLIHLV